MFREMPYDELRVLADTYTRLLQSKDFQVFLRELKYKREHLKEKLVRLYIFDNPSTFSIEVSNIQTEIRTLDSIEATMEVVIGEAKYIDTQKKNIGSY